VFWIKGLCDLYLYGYVVVPDLACPVCGRRVKDGELASGKLHPACVPTYQKRSLRWERK